MKEKKKIRGLHRNTFPQMVFERWCRLDYTIILYIRTIGGLNTSMFVSKYNILPVVPTAISYCSLMLCPLTDISSTLNHVVAAAIVILKEPRRKEAATSCTVSICTEFLCAVSLFLADDRG